MQEVFPGDVATDATPSGSATPAVSIPVVSAAAPPLPMTKEKGRLLQEQELVPNVVSTTPTSITKLVWPGPDGGLRVFDLGSVVTPSQVHERPRFNYIIHAN